MKSEIKYKVVVYESVMKKLEADIARHPPERGGYMFGNVKDDGTVELMFFVLDAKASVTGALFVPSDEANVMLTRMNVVAKAMYGESVKFISVVHSHPGCLDHPSTGDAQSAMLLFDKNPGLTFVVTPIITKTELNCLLEHELSLGPNHKISFYCFTPGNMSAHRICVKRIHGEHPVYGSGYELETTWNVDQACLELQKRFGLQPPLLSWIVVQGRQVLRAHWQLNGNIEIIGVFTRDFPLSAPLLWYYENNNAISGIAQPEWTTSVSPLERMVKCFSTFLIVDEPLNETTTFRVCYGTDKQHLLSNDKEIAKKNNWKAYITNYNIDIERRQKNTLSRVKNCLVDGIFKSGKVIIIGCGSVGCGIADSLARAGICRLVLIDDDTVSEPNIARSVFTLAQHGMPKVDALAQHLWAINPSLNIETIFAKFETNYEHCMKHYQDANMIVCSTDDMNTQKWASDVAYLMGKTTIMVGLYDKCKGGEIIHCNPCLDLPCYACILGPSNNKSVQPRNYGFGGDKLAAVPAIGPDISFFTNLATKMILALLTVSLGKEYYDKQPNERPRLFNFGLDIVLSKLDYVVGSLYHDFFTEFTTNFFGNCDTCAMRRCLYAHSYSWFCTSKLQDVIERRQNCSICGKDKIELDKYLGLMFHPTSDDIRDALTEEL